MRLRRCMAEVSVAGAGHCSRAVRAAPQGRPRPAYHRLMNVPLVIRPLQDQDWEQWLLLWHGYNAFYGRAGATSLADEITGTTWQRFFDADEPVHALVAQQGERLVGLAHYLFHRSTTRI